MDLGSKSHGHPAVATWWHAPSPRAATPVESKPLRCWGARDAAPNPPVSVPPGSWMRAPHDIPQESNISVANVSKANASNVNARPVFTLLHILTYMSTLIESISCLAVGVWCKSPFPVQMQTSLEDCKHTESIKNEAVLRTLTFIIIDYRQYTGT